MTQQRLRTNGSDWPTGKDALSCEVARVGVAPFIYFPLQRNHISVVSDNTVASAAARRRQRRSISKITLTSAPRTLHGQFNLTYCHQSSDDALYQYVVVPTLIFISRLSMVVLLAQEGGQERL